MKKQTPETFWSKVSVGDPEKCWLWKASTVSNGYGQVKWSGKMVLAHRLAAYLSGKLQNIEKLETHEKSNLVCHKCDVRNCCNPAHLFIGNSADNMRDAMLKNRMVGRKGVKHHYAKLSETDVLKILEMAKAGKKSEQIAEIFPVSPRTIRKIISGDRWGHINAKGAELRAPRA